MSYKSRINFYLKKTRPVLIGIDITKYLLALLVLIFGWHFFVSWVIGTNVRPLHSRLLNNPEYATPKLVYQLIFQTASVLLVFWLLTILKNFIAFTVLRNKDGHAERMAAVAETRKLPKYPYTRESFAIILGELQDRDGSRVPNEKNPAMEPRWLIIPEEPLYTGFFVTGAIGSGKTESAAKPMLRQMIGHRRMVQVKKGNGIIEMPYVWSGLVTDEKGDFCSITQQICKEWGREKDFIRIAPEGYWKWNPIYNPGLPTWTTANILQKLLKRFNKGRQGNDPFWETSAASLLKDYITLMEDAEGYYSINDYLKVLINQNLQDELHDKAVAKWEHRDDYRFKEIMDRMARIQNRRDEYGPNLLGSINAVSKAGLDLFEVRETRATFSPTFEEYYTGPCSPWPRRVPKNDAEKALFAEQEEKGLILPKPDIFTGFDTNLENGTIVGLDMPKTRFYEAATFMQIALKSMFQTSIFRRDTKDSNGNLIIPYQFGEDIGYAPAFIFADECQESADPEDQNFMAQCRSKKACCVWLTQSHTSIIAAMGQGQKENADAFFQNTKNHIYFQQSDLESMQKIEKEVGTKDVTKISHSISESGQKTNLDLVSGTFTHEGGMSISETQNTNLEEKPFFEIETLKQIPVFSAVVVTSMGSQILPATLVYMRPTFLFPDLYTTPEKPCLIYPDLTIEDSWWNWPEELKKSVTLETIPQEIKWEGFKTRKGVKTGPIEERADNLSGFLAEPMLADPQLDEASLTTIAEEPIATAPASANSALNKTNDAPTMVKPVTPASATSAPEKAKQPKSDYKTKLAAKITANEQARQEKQQNKLLAAFNNAVNKYG
jgi:hypothetical protein